MSEYFEFLYNSNFGVFEFSEKFKNVYKITTGEDFNELYLNDVKLRTNPVILKIVKLIGLKNSQGEFSEFEIRIFPKKFYNYMKLCDCDGSETPYIDINQYIIDLIMYGTSEDFWYIKQEVDNCTGVNKYGIKLLKV